MSYFAVVGRICGDDEDSCYIFERETSEEAVSAFKAEIVADRLDEDSKAEVFINHVLESATQILMR